jgi:hypothetical protein
VLPKTLGKDFAECGTRQSLLGKIWPGKETLPSAFSLDTRHNKNIFCRVPLKALGKIFTAVRSLAVNQNFAERPKTLGKFFLEKLKRKLRRAFYTKTLGKDYFWEKNKKFCRAFSYESTWQKNN